MGDAAAYREVRIERWDEYKAAVHDDALRSWAFRGQRDARWQLSSTLSRYLTDYRIAPDVWPEQEARILRIFQRKSHLFLPAPPDEHDAFEWLALMQHHGSPTRLLDFTWSPYVAAFFALETAVKDAAVWAIHPGRINDIKERTLESLGAEPRERSTWAPGVYEKFFLPSKHRVVLIGEAFRMNRRLIAQSGTFAIPGLLTEPLEQLVDAGDVVKLTLNTVEMRDEAMRDLYSMNMTHATLFPDLDGLARSMAYELESHWAFDPKHTTAIPGFTAKSSQV